MGKPTSGEAGEGAEVTPGYLPDWDEEGVLVWRVVEESAGATLNDVRVIGADVVPYNSSTPQ